MLSSSPPLELDEEKAETGFWAVDFFIVGFWAAGFFPSFFALSLLAIFVI